MSSNGMHLEPESDDVTQSLPVDPDIQEVEVQGPDEDDEIEVDDVQAEIDRVDEARGYGVSEAAQPDSQGQDPFLAEIGENGQGDLAPEDL